VPTAPLVLSQQIGTPITTSASIDACWPAWNQQLQILVGTPATEQTWASLGALVQQHNTVWTNWNLQQSWPCTIITASTSAATYNLPGVITTNHSAWEHWNHGFGVPVVMRHRERSEAEERAYQEQQRTYAAQQAEERKAREEAKVKARKLLRENLSPAQLESFDRVGYFFQEIGGRRYKINLGRSGNVYEVDKNDKHLTRFCIHPAMDVPDEDTVLAQKLLLSANEQEFRRIANATRC
jgi:hypothetical protein